MTVRRILRNIFTIYYLPSTFISKYLHFVHFLVLAGLLFPVERQKEPKKLVIRGRCRSSATLGHGNMASDVALSVSVDTPRHVTGAS